jgi:hypothetical protein
MSKGLGPLQTDVLGLMLATPGGDEIPAYWARPLVTFFPEKMVRHKLSAPQITARALLAR